MKYASYEANWIEHIIYETILYVKVKVQEDINLTLKGLIPLTVSVRRNLYCSYQQCDIYSKRHI